MVTIKVDFMGKTYDATLTRYDEGSDTYFADLSYNGQWSQERAFPGDMVRSLNPFLRQGNRPGKPLSRW